MENENIHLVGQKILKSSAQKNKKKSSAQKTERLAPQFFSHFIAFINL